VKAILGVSVQDLTERGCAPPRPSPRRHVKRGSSKHAPPPVALDTSSRTHAVCLAARPSADNGVVTTEGCKHPRNWEGGCGGTVAHATRLSQCLPHRLSHCVSHCVPLCLPLCLPHRVSHCLPLSPSPCLPLCLPLCLYHRVSHCVSLTVSPTASPSPCLPLSPSPCLPLCLPLCLSHRVSHCVSLTVSSTVSPTVSPTVSLTASPSPCLPLSPSSCLPLCLPLCLSYRVSHCVSLAVSPTVSLPLSLSLCLPRRVSHCVSHRVSHCVSQLRLPQLLGVPAAAGRAAAGGGHRGGHLLRARRAAGEGPRRAVQVDAQGPPAAVHGRAVPLALPAHQRVRVVRADASGPCRRPARLDALYHKRGVHRCIMLAPRVNTICTALSLTPTVNGNTVRSFPTHGQLSAAQGSSTNVSR
jgi:hypothetical protein